jgi:hypothetical protein
MFFPSEIEQQIGKAKARIEKVRACARETTQEIYRQFFGKPIPKDWENVLKRFDCLGYGGKIYAESEKENRGNKEEVEGRAKENKACKV